MPVVLPLPPLLPSPVSYTDLGNFEKAALMYDKVSSINPNP